MALDEPQDDDSRLEVDGLPFAVAPRDDGMIFSRGAVRVDYAESPWGSGFYVTPMYATSCC